MRMIDADALINELNNNRYPGAPYVDTGISIAIGKVCDAPTIEERKTGEWYKPNGVMPPEHFGRHRCSICDAFAMHDWKHHREQLTDYCPNCGADMRGDDHEND